MCKALSTCLAYSCCPGCGGRALGCPGPRGKEWTQAGQRTLEWRELQVEPETIAIPLLINEAAHQLPQRKWNSAHTLMGLAPFADAKSENLVIRPRMGRQTPTTNGMDRDLRNIIEEEDWDLRDKQLP